MLIDAEETSSSSATGITEPPAQLYITGKLEQYLGAGYGWIP